MCPSDHSGSLDLGLDRICGLCCLQCLDLSLDLRRIEAVLSLLYSLLFKIDLTYRGRQLISITQIHSAIRLTEVGQFRDTPSNDRVDSGP